MEIFTLCLQQKSLQRSKKNESHFAILDLDWSFCFLKEKIFRQSLCWETQGFPVQTLRLETLTKTNVA